MTSSSTGNPLSRLIAGAEPTAAPESAPPLDSTDLYINRDLSLLAFQRRVFAEAATSLIRFWSASNLFPSSDRTLTNSSWSELPDYGSK